MNKNPPAFVSVAASHRVIVSSVSSEIAAYLLSLGFSNTSAGEFEITCESKEQKALLFKQLRDNSICFSTGKEWSPAEVFEYLRDQKLLSGSFKEISWQGPGQWIVRDK